MSSIIPAGGSYSFHHPKYSCETFPTLEIGEENINYLSKTLILLETFITEPF
jgi:hypothetical protein